MSPTLNSRRRRLIRQNETFSKSSNGHVDAPHNIINAARNNNEGLAMITPKIDEQETIEQLLALSEQLLQSIAEGDWSTYCELCDPTLSCFEPESRGQWVEGLEFHQYYFDNDKPSFDRNTTICSPHVRLMGDVAVVCYVRLVQTADDAGKLVTRRFEETRVWQRQESGWRHVHFHRSASA